MLILEQSDIEERVGGGRTVGDEHIEGEQGEGCFDLDFARLEPTALFAAIEDQLKAHDAQGQEAETKPVQFAGCIA